MAIFLTAFKAVAFIFPVLSIGTGAQALFAPVAFSKSFGLPVDQTASPAASVSSFHSSTATVAKSSITESYISLMGVRQLAAGIVLGVFALQGKYTESATMFTIIGPLQAGTDGLYLASGGNKQAGLFHAIPGFIMAGLAAGYLYFHA